jgi:hypothetical protein
MTQTTMYTLEGVEEQTLTLPEGSSVITGMIKNDNLCIWVKEDPDATRISKTFKFFDTKDNGYAAGYHYVCTILVDDDRHEDHLFMQK